MLLGQRPLEGRLAMLSMFDWLTFDLTHRMGTGDHHLNHYRKVARGLGLVHFAGRLPSSLITSRTLVAFNHAQSGASMLVWAVV